MYLRSESPRLFTTPAATAAGAGLNTLVIETKEQRHIPGTQKYTIANGDTLAIGPFYENGVKVPIGTVYLLLTTELNGTVERLLSLTWADLAGTPATNQLPYLRAAANETAELFIRGARSALADVAAKKVTAFNVQNNSGVSVVVEVTTAHPTAPA